jgi:hypothetical protein
MSFGQVLQLRRLECCQYPGGEHFNGIWAYREKCILTVA